MPKLLIIADDFTGALDTGGQFAKKKIPTYVTLNTNIDYAQLDQFEVLVIDSETRHKSSEEAFLMVLKIAVNARKNKLLSVYKKVDSTLRGNVGSELMGCIIGLERDQLFLVPAYPDYARGTVNGIQYVNGVPLVETNFAKDPFNPIPSSSVKEIIETQCRYKIREVNLKKNQSTDLDEECIYILDGEEKSDLDYIGNKLKNENKLKLTAGCAGFAENLSNLIDFRKKTPKTRMIECSFLVVSGSLNVLSRKQIFDAKKRGAVVLFIDQFIDLDKKDQKKEAYKILDKVKLGLLRTKKVIISSMPEIEKGYFENKNRCEIEKARVKTLECLSILTAFLLEATKIKNLVVFGGDTLASIMEQLGEQGFEPIDEIASGVIFSRCKKMNVISKAGGLGNINVIEEIEMYLKKVKTQGQSGA